MDEEAVEGQVELQEEYDENYEPTEAGPRAYTPAKGASPAGAQAAAAHPHARPGLGWAQTSASMPRCWAWI